MRIRILYLLFFILIFCNCNGQQVEKTEAGNTKEHTFQMVSVPSVITEPEERAAYLVKHYWDKFDFTDTFPGNYGASDFQLYRYDEICPGESGCFFYQRDDE